MRDARIFITPPAAAQYRLRRPRDGAAPPIRSAQATRRQCRQRPRSQPTTHDARSRTPSGTRRADVAKSARTHRFSTGDACVSDRSDRSVDGASTRLFVGWIMCQTGPLGATPTVQRPRGRRRAVVIVKGRSPWSGRLPADVEPVTRHGTDTAQADTWAHCRRGRVAAAVRTCVRLYPEPRPQVPSARRIRPDFAADHAVRRYVWRVQPPPSAACRTVAPRWSRQPPAPASMSNRSPPPPGTDAARERLRTFLPPQPIREPCQETACTTPARSPETVSPRGRYGASARPPRRLAHRRRTARSWRLQHPPVAVRNVPETAESSPVHRARRRTSTTSTTARTQSARRRSSILALHTFTRASPLALMVTASPRKTRTAAPAAPPPDPRRAQLPLPLFESCRHDIVFKLVSWLFP